MLETLVMSHVAYPTLSHIAGCVALRKAVCELAGLCFFTLCSSVLFSVGVFMGCRFLLLTASYVLCNIFQISVSVRSLGFSGNGGAIHLFCLCFSCKCTKAESTSV